MEELLQYIYQNAEHAHWIIFGLLILAGFNVPVSEDLMLITGGVIASTMYPENTAIIFACIFAGAYVSDWIAYWLGRLLGRKLLDISWFKRSFPEERLNKVQNYYDKYGFLTLLLGRFIPFVVRNLLFISAGFSRMHFGKFLISDGIACIISNSALFFLTYSLGKNYKVIFSYLATFDKVIFGVALFVIASLIFAYWYKKKKSRKAS